MLPRLIALLLLSAAPALSADWWPYDNLRYGYSIELPPEFMMASFADRTDGLTLVPADKSARLLVFGTDMLTGNLSAQATVRMSLARQDGWQISYSKFGPKGVTFSGMRGDRIVYGRGVALCNGSAAFFQMDYPKADMQRYDAVVMRLVRSLHPTEKCNGAAKQVFKGSWTTG